MKSPGATAFPLRWPDSWPRTPVHRRTRSKYKQTAASAQQHLLGELSRLGARNVIVSTNVPLRRDGTHYVDDGNFEDPGCAVYWSDKRGEHVMACDRWVKVYENEYAISVAIESLRAIERSGATQILDRAFAAFGQLPPAESTRRVVPWFEVLDLPESALPALSLPMVEAKYRELAAKAHPDRGGTVEAMAVLNRAIEEARQHYGKGG
jgi:hypothetical protein